jgi:hypothetical protein
MTLFPEAVGWSLSVERGMRSPEIVVGEEFGESEGAVGRGWPDGRLFVDGDVKVALRLC